MMSGRRIGRKLFSVFMGIAVSSLLFFFMPFSYHLFQKQMRELLALKSGNRVAVSTVAAEKPQQKQKKMLKPQQKEMEKQNLSMMNRFSLDLSVLSEGDGAGGIAAGGGRVIDESEADTPPIKRITVPPVYPARARDNGVEGLVVARILIGEDGRVQQVVILEAPAGYGFDKAVTNALMKWKFEPARLENMPVRVWARQEIRFSL